MIRWTWALLSAACLTAGCATCSLSPPPVGEDLIEACSSVAECSRKHVYLFFVQELDPLDRSGLEPLKEQMQALGFPNAWYGPSCYAARFKKEIARIQQEDHEAHFVIVGYGHGVKTAHDIVRTVGAQGISFDLMVCLGESVPRPETVGRMLTILPCGACADYGSEVHVLKVRSLALPGHVETAKHLSLALLAIAGSIPAEALVPEAFFPQQEPTPRPVMPPAEPSSRDEWDFLKPASAENRPVPLPGKRPTPPKAAPSRHARTVARAPGM